MNSLSYWFCIVNVCEVESRKRCTHSKIEPGICEGDVTGEVETFQGF